LLLIVTTLTLLWVPAFFHRIVTRPWIWPLPVAALVSAGWVLRGLSRARELEAFLASCAFLALLLVGTAATLYPTLLRSTLDDAFSLDTASSTSSATLRLGLALWIPAIVLATAYFVHTFRSFRGKVGQADAHE
jgi:cytochrome d ubiquinol oxidase subunit II